MVILLGNLCTLTPPYSCAMAQAISRRYLIADARVRSQFGPCGIFGGQSAIWTSFLLVFQLYPLIIGGTLWRSWLRHYATSPKVAGSIPDGVTGIFH